MSVTTRQQKMAEAAFSAVSGRPRDEKYKSFAKSFPSLIHTAGLCQAVAFAQAKGKGSGAQSQVLEDVLTSLKAALDAAVAKEVFPTTDAFADEARTAPVTDYLRLTRLALQAATWVKRYVEALDAPSPSPSIAEPSAEPR